MTKILAPLMLMIPFLSNATPVFDVNLVMLHKGQSEHRCKTDYRPITTDEALMHQSHFESIMEEYQITSIEKPNKIFGRGYYDGYLGVGSAHETFCYPIKTINPVLIELHKVGAHKCEINYRPITSDEALLHKINIQSNMMGPHQISAIESPYKIFGPGYFGPYLEIGSANETFCYPLEEANEIADSQLFIPSLVEKFISSTRCPDEYRVPTEFEISQNLNSLEDLLDNGTNVALEYPWILVNFNGRHFVEQGTSNDLLCYPRINKAVVLYEHGYHAGRSISLRKSQPNLNKIQFNDVLSSFEIPEGTSVVFYSEVNYDGRSFTKTESQKELGVEMNDKIRSIKILPRTN